MWLAGEDPPLRRESLGGLALLTGILNEGIAMRATIARTILGLFAAGAVVLGILALFGLKPVGDRLTTVLVALGAIGCGVAVLRFVFGERAA